MNIAIASIFSILLGILSVLFHLACAAAIVICFVFYLNSRDDGKKRRYLTAIIVLAVILVLMLIVRPLLWLFGIAAFFP